MLTTAIGRRALLLTLPALLCGTFALVGGPPSAKPPDPPPFRSPASPANSICASTIRRCRSTRRAMVSRPSRT